MCGGPTGAQKQLQADQIAFYEEATKEAQTTFGEQQDIFNMMKNVYEPILQAGPNQRGFSDAELSNLNAQAVEGTATNYKAAAKAISARLAARGGGDNPLPSGVDAAIEAGVATNSAREQSREESQILSDDYAEGRNQFNDASAALSGQQRIINPVDYNNAATGAGSAAEKTASDIAMEQSSWINAALGAAGAVGGGLASNPNLFK